MSDLWTQPNTHSRPTRIKLYVISVDEYCSRSGREYTGNHIHCCRLSGAVVSEKYCYSVLTNIERKVIDSSLTISTETTRIF